MTRKKLQFSLLACYIGVGLIGGVIMAVHDHQLAGEAAGGLQQAEQDAAATWTEDDAVRWLHDHDFAWAGKGEGTQSRGRRPEERHYVTLGFRELAAADRLNRPAWLQVSFVFDLDHRFVRAEKHLMRYEPPVGRSGKTTNVDPATHCPAPAKKGGP